MAELASNPALQPLRQCRHLVVSFGNDGAVWLDLEKPEAPAAVLIFDPAHGEGEWCDGVKGEVFGYNTCLVAAVVAELTSALEKDSKPNVAQRWRADCPLCAACGRMAMAQLNGTNTPLRALDFPWPPLRRK